MYYIHSGVITHETWIVTNKVNFLTAEIENVVEFLASFMAGNYVHVIPVHF
jgi:hypothetical protein